ncbi:MAG: Gfo/Idh/MocA family protein [Acidobacteriota bacterium]
MKEINRREFVKGAAAAAAAPLVLKQARASVNDRLQVVCVGVRGRGRNHIHALQQLPDVRVAALCDVDENVLGERLNEFEKEGWHRPKTYTDLRRALEDADIDAVFIATPNHWHALATIWACQAGKDVYVEKPVSHNIREGRRMVEAARKYGRIVQTGFQIRSSIAVQAAVKFLQTGQLGRVYMARGLCFKWRDTIGHAPDETVPAGVHYDLWLGPAPRCPFSRNRFHYNWHWNWDYGNGDIGNQGVHQLDIARWGLGLDQHPVKVSATGAHVLFDDDQETPNLLNVGFEYPAATEPGGRKIINFEVRPWMTNHEAGIGEDERNTVGVVFYGSEGYLAVDSYNSWRTYLGPKREPGPYARAGGNHFENFVRAVKARDPDLLNCNVEEGHRSAALAHLANASYRLGRSLKFDPEREKFVDDAEADTLLSRHYREPFVVPAEV